MGKGTIRWYKFTATKDEAFTIDTQYLNLQKGLNAHLYMRDGYTWEVWRDSMDIIPIPPETNYYLKSDHDSFSNMILRDMPKAESLEYEPNLTGCFCYWGGSNGKSSVNY